MKEQIGKSLSVNGECVVHHANVVSVCLTELIKAVDKWLLYNPIGTFELLAMPMVALNFALLRRARGRQSRLIRLRDPNSRNALAIKNELPAVRAMHSYEVRPRKDHHGVDLVSDALPFGRLWYGEPGAVSNAVDYAKFRNRSHDAVIRAAMKRAT